MRAWLIAPLSLALALTAAGCGGTREANKPANTANASTNADVKAPTNQEVRDAQQKLQQLGLYNGPIDGIYGPTTIAAVRRFQAENGLPQTGALTSDTEQHLQTAQANQPNNPSQTAQQPATNLPTNQPNTSPGQNSNENQAAPAQPAR